MQAQSSAGAHRAENSDTQTQSSVGERSGAELQLEQPTADDSSIFEDAQSNAEELPRMDFTIEDWTPSNAAEALGHAHSSVGSHHAEN